MKLLGNFGEISPKVELESILIILFTAEYNKLYGNRIDEKNERPNNLKNFLLKIFIF